MLVGSASSNHREQHAKAPSKTDSLDDYLSQDRSPTSLQCVQEVASSTLIDSLAAEWWSINLSPVVINDFLENLIPIVVLACEKVIHEADERHLIESTAPDRSFNPINCLASFLMRNNPKYMHYSSLSPYHHSMKTLLNTKKVQVLKVYGEEETLLRTMLKGRQHERQQSEGLIESEEQRRKQSLKALFHDWNVSTRGWIQTKLVNNMIEQSNDATDPSDQSSTLPRFQSHRMHLETFIQNFLQALCKHSSESFDATVGTYRRFARTYSAIIQEHELDLLLQRLFDQLDEKKTGHLFRRHVVQTLEKFYAALNDHDRQYVHRPDQWPVSTTTPPVSEKVSQEKPVDASVKADQEIRPSIPTDKKETEASEIDSQTLTIELKNPSIYDANYRYTTEQKPIYNLEHFDTADRAKSIPFDERFLNRIQFSSLLISFIGLDRNEMVVSALIDYFRSHYKETNEEASEKRNLLQKNLIDAQRRAQCDQLFERMNSKCTGLIKRERVETALKQYKEGAVIDQIEQILEMYQNHPKLTSTQFFDLLVHIHRTLKETLGESQKFDELLKFIENQEPQLNTADRARSVTRHQWLKRLRSISFRTLGHLYKEVMDIIQKDADTFGSQPSKYLSIYIALLENDRNRIRYVATTNDQTDLLLGKTLQRDQGISFQILDSGRWAYINQTKKHTRVHFFNPAARNQSGSFVLMPLKRLQGQCSNGLLGIDTLREKRDKAFVEHEIRFYESIASTLSDAFTLMHFHHNMMKMMHRFIYWVKQRCPYVSTVDYYTYEPTLMDKPDMRTLKHVSRYSHGHSTVFDTPVAVNSSEQVFHYHLEHAASSCQSAAASFLGQTHLIHAVRRKDRFCFALIDTSLDAQEKSTNDQKQDLASMYRCVDMTVDELEQELMNDTRKSVLDYEKQSDEMHLNYLFDRLWYTDICHRLKHIPAERVKELVRNESQWGNEIKHMLASISLLVQKKELNSSDYDSVLLAAMSNFDPSTKEHADENLWNRAAQSTKDMASSTDQFKSTDVIRTAFDWLQLACELHRIAK